MADISQAIIKILSQNNYILKRLKKVEQHYYQMLKCIQKHCYSLADNQNSIIPNPTDETSNFIFPCEDFAEKATWIKNDKIRYGKDNNN